MSLNDLTKDWGFLPNPYYQENYPEGAYEKLYYPKDGSSPYGVYLVVPNNKR